MKIEIYLNKKLVDMHDEELKQFQIRSITENYKAHLKGIDRTGTDKIIYYFERPKK